MTPDSKKMKYKQLGRNAGVKVSELCLGAMTFGASGAAFGGNFPSEADEKVCFDIMDAFVARGGNFIDTANVYGLGNSERVVGKWLKSVRSGRDSIVVATKGHFPFGTGPNQNGSSRKHLVAALEGSLERLGTHYIDLYQLHNFDSSTPLKETLLTLNDFVRSGKVMYIGASNFGGWQLQKSVDLSRELGLEIFASLQQQYSLLERGLEYDVAGVCGHEGIGILPWSPLKGGWLTGRYTRDMAHPPAGSRVAWAQNVGWAETNYDTLANEHTFGVVDELTAISQEIGKSIPAVALRWLMQKPNVTAPIIGARTLKQLESNLEAIDFELSAEQMKRLDRKSAKPLPYPYNLQQGFLF
ncbi:hypothetical protein HK102_008558 [Quaeritorhiza haematococci]|nr:hypothetical protein HK102_008558 [Quaeritorhiza haematococci]